MQSSFSHESFQKLSQLLPEGYTLDFSRCVRKDGTAYGTKGKCRKGVEQAKEVLRRITKRPKEETQDQDFEDRWMEKRVKQLAAEPERQKIAIREYDINRGKANSIRAADDGSTVVVSNQFDIVLKRNLNEYDRVSLKFQGSTKEVEFLANGEHDYGSIEDPRDKVKAALTVRRMFGLLTQSLSPGDVIHCYAYDEDGRGDKRKKAYERIGFVDKGEGQLVGQVRKGGGVEPPHSFSENLGSLRDWYVVLFGELPSRGTPKDHLG